MPARLNLRHQSMVREKIRATKLIKVLQAYALDEEFEGRKINLSKERIRSIEVLLRKSLPDLSNVTVSGDPDHPLEKNLTVTFE